MAKEKKKNSIWWIIGIILLGVLIYIIVSGKIVSISNIYKKPLPTSTPSPKPLTIFPPNINSPPQEEYVSMAKKDLAAKLKINMEEIKEVKTEPIDWNDTSLGCPEKGKLYPQVITSGLIITLSAEQQTYNYHAGLNRVITCKKSN